MPDQQRTARGDIELLMITADPMVAASLESAGVDTVFVDLEVRGKAARQAGRNTVISGHSINDVRAVRAAVSGSRLLVRVNPWWEGSEDEIDAVLEAGADTIMLPFFTTEEEVAKFTARVGSAAKTCLLFETSESVDRMDAILDVGGIDAAFVGLNDLHIAYGKQFMFELLCDGTVERLCDSFARRGLRYGFGGMARIGALVPPAERVLAEHYRLGSSMVILSRSFFDLAAADRASVEAAVSERVREIREVEKGLRAEPAEFFLANRELLCREVSEVVASRA